MVDLVMYAGLGSLILSALCMLYGIGGAIFGGKR